MSISWNKWLYTDLSKYVNSTSLEFDLKIQNFSENIITPLPRQKLSNLYNLNGALYLSSRESILQNKSFISNSTIGYIMSEESSIDIDTPLDWDIAEYLISKFFSAVLSVKPKVNNVRSIFENTSQMLL